MYSPWHVFSNWCKNFANILQHDVFPLARILQLVQKYGQGEMRRPVEIEFAVNLDAKEKRGVFYLLQIRPMVDMKADLEEDLETIPEEQRKTRRFLSLANPPHGRHESRLRRRP